MTKDGGIDRDMKMKRIESILESEIDGDVIALSIDKGMCYGFNEVGSRVWQILEQGVSIREISDLLVREYDVDSATCEEEVARLVGELHAEGMIRPAGQSGRSDRIGSTAPES